MQRVAIILMLFIMLMNGRHSTNTLPSAFDSLVVHVRPLAQTGDPARYGPLRLTGAWQLTGSHEAFGGLSSMRVAPDGAITALNDTGELFGFRVDGPRGKGFVEPLPTSRAERKLPRWKWDSESMARDPATGRMWVGMELIQRICRYAPDFKRLERCAEPKAMAAWPMTGSIESMTRLGDGRFLAISEMGMGAPEAHDVLLWAGDPVEPATPPPVHLAYHAPPGYRPTDMLWLGGDRLLVLNRRLTVADGFTARLSLVHLPRLRAGAALRGKVVADFMPPGPVDNFEALALSFDRGKPQLWIGADDNHFTLQRSLLLRFALPADWVSNAPPP
jgi:hypothetical protein